MAFFVLLILVHSYPFSEKQEREMIKLCVVWRRRTSTANVSCLFYLELIAILLIWPEQNFRAIGVQHRTRLLRIFLVKYKFVFNSVSPSSLLKLFYHFQHVSPLSGVRFLTSYVETSCIMFTSNSTNTGYCKISPSKSTRLKACPYESYENYEFNWNCENYIKLQYHR